MTSFFSCPCLSHKILPKPSNKRHSSTSNRSLAGALMAGILQQRDTDTCVRMGLLAARMSLASPHPIAPTLTLDSVNPNKVQAHYWPKPSLLWID